MHISQHGSDVHQALIKLNNVILLALNIGTHMTSRGGFKLQLKETKYLVYLNALFGV